MQVESSVTPLLTIDEIENVHLQVIDETERLNCFSGCSKRQPKTPPFLALFLLHVRGNAPSFLLQLQLFIFLTIKFIRQLYPVSILFTHSCIQSLFLQ